MDSITEFDALMRDTDAEAARRIEDQLEVRRAARERLLCPHTGKRLSPPDTVVIKMRHRDGQVTSQPVHATAWDTRKSHLIRKLGPANVWALDGRQLFG